MRTSASVRQPARSTCGNQRRRSARARVSIVRSSRSFASSTCAASKCQPLGAYSGAIFVSSVASFTNAFESAFSTSNFWVNGRCCRRDTAWRCQVPRAVRPVRSVARWCRRRWPAPRRSRVARHQACAPQQPGQTASNMRCSTGVFSLTTPGVSACASASGSACMPRAGSAARPRTSIRRSKRATAADTPRSRRSPDAGQKWPEKRLDRRIREPARAQLLLGGAAGPRHVPNTVPARGRQPQAQTRQTHAIAQGQQRRTQSLQEVRRVPQWIAQEHRSSGGDDRRAIVEQRRSSLRRSTIRRSAGYAVNSTWKPRSSTKPSAVTSVRTRPPTASPASRTTTGVPRRDEQSGARQARRPGANDDDRYGWIDLMQQRPRTSRSASTVCRVIRWRYANRRPRNARSTRSSTGARLPPGSAYSSSSRNRVPSPSGSTMCRCLQLRNGPRTSDSTKHRRWLVHLVHGLRLHGERPATQHQQCSRAGSQTRGRTNDPSTGPPRRQ